MEKNVKYWLDISEYDLETAEAMLEKARFLTSVSCAIRRLEDCESLLPERIKSASTKNAQHHSVGAAVKSI